MWKVRKETLYWKGSEGRAALKQSADQRLLADETAVTIVCVASLNSVPAPVGTFCWIQVMYPYYVSAKSIVCTILFIVMHSNGGNINRTERVSQGRRVYVGGWVGARSFRHAQAR